MSNDEKRWQKTTNKQKSDKTEQRWPKINKNRDGQRVKDKKKKDGQKRQTNTKRQTRTKMARDKQK